ncbi:MAG: glycosyltransferase family 1 protein [Planctomycetes bacterium]|nr:glycosyltransferase family 1 protein [Planctomycetota bacterium]
MSHRPLRIATTAQLHRSVREAGFDAYLLPDLPSTDINRSLKERLDDGAIYRPFLEENEIELVVDIDTSALTLVPSSTIPENMALTTADLNIPYVACFIDPVKSIMGRVDWADWWHLLESDSWIKWVWEKGHAEELIKLGVPNIVTMPMAAANDDFDTDPLPEPGPGASVAFMGHPATSWFSSQQSFSPAQIHAALTAAAVSADMPDLTFSKIFYDLYGFAEPPDAADDRSVRARKSADYFNQKFVYNAYLAIKQRDRFAQFLKAKLGDLFELIGDHWGTEYNLPHTPRIWDMKVLHDRMRRVPICLNLMKGCIETGLNNRHFEITAYGGFMLTYFTSELPDCFEIGKECEVFRDEQELLEKINYYLEHDKERREIAAAGQRRTLSKHLFSHRITTLVELLRGSGILKKVDGESIALGETRQMDVSAVTTVGHP